MATMQFGVMQRGVFPQGEDMRARFAELMEQARLLERLGYDSITKGSHYSTYPMHEMIQLPYLSRVMAEAPSLRLNAGIVLLALHKPLDVAEQIATMDLMSGGKMIFGCALGYRDVEYKAFGVPREERIKLGKEIWATAADEVHIIGVIGLGPAAMGVRVAKTDLGNIPSRQYNSPDARTPSISRPVTFFWKSAENRQPQRLSIQE